MTTLLPLNQSRQRAIPYYGNTNALRFGKDRTDDPSQSTEIPSTTTAGKDNSSFLKTRLGRTVAATVAVLALGGIGIGASAASKGSKPKPTKPPATTVVTRPTTTLPKPTTTLPATTTPPTSKPVCENPFSVGPFKPTDFSKIPKSLAGVVVYPEGSANTTIADYNFTEAQLQEMMADFANKMSSNTKAEDVLKDILEVYNNPSIIQNSPNSQLRAGLAMGLAIPDDTATRTAMKDFILNSGNFLGIQEANTLSQSIDHEVFVWFPDARVNQFNIFFKKPYMKEHPIFIASFIFHELAHHDPTVNSFEEMILNSLSDLSIMKVIARNPELLDNPSSFLKEFILGSLVRLNSSDGKTARLEANVDVLPGTQVDELANVTDYASFYNNKEFPYPEELATTGNPLLDLYLKVFTQKPELGRGSFDAGAAAAIDSGINPKFLSNEDIWKFLKAAGLVPVNAPPDCVVPA